MDANTPKPTPDRAETDQTIEVERQLADAEFQKQQLALEKSSDATTEKARHLADEALQEVQAAVEEAPLLSDAKAEARRAVENAKASLEQAAADTDLANERKERKLALAQLLRFEREATDEQLNIERLQADEAVAARDDFLAVVSHDLRNLLGGIAMSAASISGSPDDELGRKNLKAQQRIRHFSARMNRLIGDLLDVASIERGRLSIRTEVFELEKLVSESLEAFQGPAAAKHISLSVRLPANPRPMKGDPERLLQVLTNLLSNAIKFTGDGGSVVLTLDTSDRTSHFTVSDTGAGIPPDQLETIFNRFWQVTKGDRRGLGLGLFISKCIVEAHGGRIWAESVLGTGSSFHVELPHP
ncbi:MAG: hypothetical protein JNG84_13335 [Archangium sp.]|nr:hypothetical protein [Archangium sp.]